MSRAWLRVQFLSQPACVHLSLFPASLDGNGSNCTITMSTHGGLVLVSRSRMDSPKFNISGLIRYTHPMVQSPSDCRIARPRAARSENDRNS